MGFATSPAEAQVFGPVTLENLISNFAIGRQIGCVIYACLTIMVWDMLLTLPMEVELLWKSRMSVLKVIFLFNRYVSALVIIVSVLFMSRLISGLTDNICRGWLAFSTFVEVFSIASTSFLYAFRLWAWYQLSTRALVALLLLWICCVLVSIGLLIDIAGVHSEDFIHEQIFNVCISIRPVLWPQWVPVTFEHGFYAFFLLFNAMRTPRSERKPALAILYRDGILFYMLTFCVCLFSVLVFRYGPRIYVSLATYPPWIIFQIAISHFLLNVKTSQLFATKERDSTPKPTPNPGMALKDIPVRDKVQRTTYIAVKHRGTRSTSAERNEEGETGEPTEHLSQVSEGNHIVQKEGLDDLESRGAACKGSYAGREIRQIQSTNGQLRRMFWWLFGKSEYGDIHVDVTQVEDEGDGWHDLGGVKESRLGRLDAYF